MRVSLEWLRELCPFEVSPEALGAKLTDLGFEVEGVERLGDGLDGVVVAEVLAVRPHPKAEKLTLVDVTDGREKRTVVCGAPNVPPPGGRVALAPPGTKLPGGLEVAARAIRGVDSPGMLCSEAELGVGEDADGILVVDATATNAPVGRPLADALALRDVVLDLAVLPNRPDALGMIGVAREVSAAYGVPLRLPPADISPFEDDPRASARTSVDVADADRCPRYVARVIDGVRIGPSPFWMRRRLGAAGVRAISNVVDVTNYVLLETGQPLHAFDLDRLRGGRIVVRAARAGERMWTLDGVERELTPEDCLICDAEMPVALAGVMGGADSEVRSETRRLLLESAYFDPRAIRRTSRRLGLSTESSLRFERGADPNGAETASRRAALLCAEIAGARVARGSVDVYPDPIDPRDLRLRIDRCNALLGVDLPGVEMARRLMALGFSVAGDSGALRVTVPTFRPDVRREADLCEEVGRAGGLDAIAAALPPLREAPRASGDPLLECARDALARAGLCEAVSLAFVSPADLDRLDLAPDDERRRAIALRNPLSEDASLVRTTMLPGLLRALARNLGRGVEAVRLFEVGRVVRARGSAGAGRPRDVAGGGDDPPDEPRHAAGLLAGPADAWLGAARPVDFHDLAGALEALADRLGLVLELRPEAARPFHPGECASVRMGGRAVGFAGQIDPRLRARFDADRSAFAFEIALEGIAPPAPVQMRALPRFPSVVRDLSLFVDDALGWGDLRRAIRETAVAHLEDVRLVDDYRPPRGRRGLLVRFTYRAPDRTLTDDEVNRAHEEHLVARLLARLPVERR